MDRHKDNSINAGQNEIKLRYCWQSSANVSNNVQAENACKVLMDFYSTVKKIHIELTAGNSKCEHFIRKQKVVYN